MDKENLNNQLSNLVFTLQKEVKNLKEDTIVNAQHLNMLKRLSAKSINSLNDEVRTHLQSTGEFVAELEKDSEANETNNYASLIKTLLNEDFAKKQNEIIEELKRQFSQKPQKVKNTSSWLSKVSFVLSLVSFSILVLICIKFKLFSQLF